jgi:hypothetical protein
MVNVLVFGGERGLAGRSARHEGVVFGEFAGKEPVGEAGLFRAPRGVRR